MKTTEQTDANETKVRSPRRYCSHWDNKWNGTVTRDGVDYCGTCGKPVKPGYCGVCRGAGLRRLLSGLIVPCPVCKPKHYAASSAEGKE
jgi:hypothetical protein